MTDADAAVEEALTAFETHHARAEEDPWWWPWLTICLILILSITALWMVYGRIRVNEHAAQCRSRIAADDAFAQGVVIDKMAALADVEAALVEALATPDDPSDNVLALDRMGSARSDLTRARNAAIQPRLDRQRMDEICN